MIRDQATGLREKVKTSRIVTIASGKGGVGKSLVTLNLAVTLSGMGKKVLVFDMDVGFANLDVLGGINVHRTLKDFFMGEKLENIIEKNQYGFWLLSGGNSANDIYAFQMGERERLFSEFYKFGNEMDYILIDMGAGYSELLDGAYTSSDDFILVITPEPTAIMDGYTFLKILSIKDIKSRLFLVVNMANDLSEGRVLVEKFQEITSKFTSLKFEKGYSILQDMKVRKSVREQNPFINSYKAIQPSFAIKGIASSITREEISAKNESSSFFNKLKGFFRMGR